MRRCGHGIRGVGGRTRQTNVWGTNLCKNCPAPRCPTVNWCNCDSRPVGGRFSWWIRALGSPPLCEQHCRRRRLPHRHPHRRPAASVPARFPIMCRNPVGKHVTTAPRTHTQQQETTTIPQSDGAGISFACSSKLIRYIVLRARFVTQRTDESRIKMSPPPPPPPPRAARCAKRVYTLQTIYCYVKIILL